MSCYWFIFCFVNQKTAYALRISDWSSDVCSSDLGTQLRIGVRVGRVPERISTENHLGSRFRSGRFRVDANGDPDGGRTVQLREKGADNQRHPLCPQLRA